MARLEMPSTATPREILVTWETQNSGLRSSSKRHAHTPISALHSEPRSSALSWSASFADPIPLPNGRKLITLKDAATYLTGPPKKESGLPEWQAAIEVLMLCSRGGDPMLARIGVMKVLHRDVVREFNSGRKETHWGKRQLKRDQ